jgi:hypothetical protein
VYVPVIEDVQRVPLILTDRGAATTTEGRTQSVVGNTRADETNVASEALEIVMYSVLISERTGDGQER